MTTVHAKLVSNADTLEAGFRPSYTGNREKQTATDQCFPYRRVNGAWPYLAKDVERDSTLRSAARVGRRKAARCSPSNPVAWSVSKSSR